MVYVHPSIRQAHRHYPRNWRRAYAARFGFTGDVQQRKVGLMSGGERNRIHLARLIKAGANVLLLDEPTNDLDVNTIRALEDALEGFAGCAVIVTHDRWFLRGFDRYVVFGDDCAVEAGLYVTAATPVLTPDGVVKARELSGISGILFIRDGQSGQVIARPRTKSWGELNAELHKN